MKIKFEEIQKFVIDHIQSKIDHNELSLTGIPLDDIDAFNKGLFIYENAITEGIINGIVWAGGEVEGIDVG